MKWMVSFLLILSGCIPCWARVDLKTTKRLIVPVDNVTPTITSADVAKVIPLDIKQTDSTGVVMNRIADRGFNLWFNSSFMKDTALVRLAETAQEKLKTDVVVPGASSDEISHKFTFRIEAFQALAKLEYTGWLSAAIDYDARAGATNVLCKEKIFDNKDLFLSHRATNHNALSMVGLAWNW